MNLRQIAAHMRAGAKLRPQEKGAFFWKGGSCALGAILESMGQEYMDASILCELDRIIAGPVFRQLGDAMPNRIYLEVQRMNDSGKTREEIAAWLESIEPDTNHDDKAAFDAFMDKLQVVTV